jgi:hypothetical protein
MSKKMLKKAEAKKTEKAQPVADTKPEAAEESSDSEIDMPIFTPELAKLKEKEMGEQDVDMNADEDVDNQGGVADMNDDFPS